MAAGGIGNPLGYVPVADGGNPRIISGRCRNEIISGGVFVYASGPAATSSSGAASVLNSEVLFTRDASGAQFNGICMQTTETSGTIAVVTRGVAIVMANATVGAGVPVMCDGNNCVLALGSVASNITATRRIGRTLTAGSSGGFVLFDIGA